MGLFNGYKDFFGFILGSILILITMLGIVWLFSAWSGKLACMDRASRLHLTHDYSYTSGCYYLIDGHFVPSSYYDEKKHDAAKGN